MVGLLAIGLMGLFVVFVGAALYFYNKLVSLSNQAQGDWNQIEPLLQQRLDTIPNLVAVAKRVMKQETDLFKGIAEAREGALQAKGVSDKISANSKLDGLMAALYMRTEAYPQMRSNEEMAKVMESIEGIEEKIKYGRQRYNYTVLDYTNAATLFPGMIFASLFGFVKDKWLYYKAEESAQKAPNVGEMLKE
jgi:LemA protein